MRIPFFPATERAADLPKFPLPFQLRPRANKQLFLINNRATNTADGKIPLMGGNSLIFSTITLHEVNQIIKKHQKPGK